MQTTEPPPTAHRPTRSASPVRGVVLVAVAVVIGFFVLRALDDTGAGPGVTTSPDATDPAAEGGEGGEDAATDTTAAPEARPPGEVVVLVANASGVQGAAGAQTEALQGGGYQVLPADNAPNQVQTTQVLPTAGYEAEAAVLATLMGASDAVEAMPDPPPVDLAGANILVLLGPDLADG
jgi:hypothetical protein